MSSTGTQTKTYTIADVKKVVDNFAADFYMIAQSTDLWARANVAKTVSELKIFAEEAYLKEVLVRLLDSKGILIKAATYEVNKSAVGWSSDRPGNALWPYTPGGSLKLTATLTSEWFAKSPEEVEEFLHKNSMGRWPTTADDLSLYNLTSSFGQRYASNGFGMERKNYD